MAIDPSIIGGLRPVQIDSPVNALAQVLRVQGMQQETQLGQAKLDEYQRTKARGNKLLELVRGLPANTTDEQRISALKGGGYFDEADRLETSMLNRQKTGAEVKAKEWEAQSKKLDLAGQAFGYVRQNPTMEAAHQVLDYLGANGVYPPETVAQFKSMVAADPSKIASLADTAFRTVLGAKEQLMKVDTRNLGGATQTIGTDPLSGQTKVLSTAVNTQSPDSEAADRRAAADRASAERRARAQIEAGRVPSGYRQQADGSLVAIPGGPADPNSPTGKQPTEFQGKSAIFGARAEEADRIISELEGQYSPAGINAKNAAASIWGVGGVLGAIGNSKLSEASQRADQAKRDFINAVLRQESGAAIAESEFDNANKQYFPQPGDSAAVIKQKAANRKLAAQGLKNNAGRAAFSAPGASAAQPAQPVQQQPALPAGWSVEVN
ncbi:MAG: hypothetical protein ACRYF7_22980 [Janthinobacterium lividum]